MKTSQGPVVIVTGASSGIGEAVSRKLFEDGFRVVLTARRTERLEALKKELEAAAQGVNTAMIASRVLSDNG